MSGSDLRDPLADRARSLRRRTLLPATWAIRARQGLIAFVDRDRWPPVEALFLAVARAVIWAQRRLAGPGCGLALVYHRLADEPGDSTRELLPALAIDRFEAQMRLIAQHYDVVPAGELPDAAARRRRGERLPIAVTFDDDDPGHVRWAAPALRRLGLPGTFFLCGASLDGPHGFWWEHLQLVFDRGLTPPSDLPDDIFAAAAVIVAMEPEDRDRVDAEMQALLGPDPDEIGLRRDQVAALAEDFEIGFHTADHHPLDTLDDERLAEALSAGRTTLEAAIGRRCSVIAYPNGRSDRRTVAAVAEAGFATGYTTQARPLRAAGDRHLIGRLEPRAGSLGVLSLRLALLPMRRAASDRD